MAVTCRALAFIALLASCSYEPEIVARSVVVYSLQSCPVTESQAFSVIYASGDFEPTVANPPRASQYLRDVGKTMASLPSATRSLIVDVSEHDLGWRGVGDVSSSGPTNVLVWRSTEACPMTRDVERRVDMGFGVFGHHFIIAGGRTPSGVPRTFVGDLSTGAIEQLAFGLTTSRMLPSITAFGTDGRGNASALVAGGTDESNVPIDSAEIYVPKLGAPSDVGDFDRDRIPLSEPRAQHGAIVLATGETLLVGGRGRTGAALRTMEMIDPATRRSRTTGLALLAVPRISPTVLRLASGEVFVAGGVDENGTAIPTLEWFAADALSATKRPADLVTGKERSFVPLAAGGALAVIRQETPTAEFKTVWVISADGTLEPATPVNPLTLTSVRLFPGAQGAPVLWTGSVWMRWAPWRGAFQTLLDAPTEGPVVDAIASGDSGLALWLRDRDTFNVTGFRFDVKTRFDPIQNPILANTTVQIAPDRLAGLPASSIQFDQRGIVLGPGASAFITDVTFADFALDLDVTARAPVIVVRDDRGEELEVGGASCAFAQAATRTLRVVRHDRRLDVSVDGRTTRPCPTAIADGVRVTIGVRGALGSNESAARNLRLVRQ